MIKRNEENIKKVAIYTRVSTEEQAKEGFSLESQLERLRAYCKAREWNITGEYVDPDQLISRNITLYLLFYIVAYL